MKAIRERSGLSNADLSASTGIDPSVITRLEKGERRGTPAQLTAIAAALRVPLLAIAIMDDEAVPA